MRAYLIIVENKINSGHGAYWWVMRKRLLKQILEVQLIEFNYD